MHRYMWSVVGLVALAITLVLATGAQGGGSSTFAAASTADLAYHGGPVMTAGAAVTPIFWGKSWSSDPQNKKGWMDTFYKGMNGSAYARTNAEYTQTGGGSVSTAITVNPGITDLSRAPKKPTPSNVLSEVARLIANPVANGYYPVYVDTPRGHAGTCAWHSSGMANGVTIQVAMIFNVDGDLGCDPGSTSTAYSQGVAALANLSGRELSATLTDPHHDAWYDIAGAENADKCAWTFGRPLLTFTNGTQWKVQGNYSNAAAAVGSGYDGSGCIDGG